MRQNRESIWKRVTKNWGLKMISLLFAIALWLVVVNVNDPTIKVTFANIPVTIENVDVITSQGMIYEVLNETDVVPRVSVYAPKSIAQNIDKSDIVAVADMNNLNSLNAISIDFLLVSGPTHCDPGTSYDKHCRNTLRNVVLRVFLLETNMMKGNEQCFLKEQEIPSDRLESLNC